MRTAIFLILFLALSLVVAFDCKNNAQITQETKDEKLISAVKGKNIAKVKELLENGANSDTFYQIGEKPNMYETVLGEAVNKKDLEIAELLLRHGANVDKNAFILEKDSRENWVSSNFGAAVFNQDVSMMKLLIEYNANLGKDDVNQPIIFSAKSKEVLDLLIDRGFDINQQEKGTGYTYLMMAVINNNLELVKIILDHKPDLSLKIKPVNKLYNFKVLTALQIAKSWIREGNDEKSKQKIIIEELVKAGAKK